MFTKSLVSAVLRAAVATATVLGFGLAGAQPAMAADTTPPTLHLPDTIWWASPTGPGVGVVDYTVTATDDVDPPGSIVISCNPPSGSAFNYGWNDVSCTATDTSGNSASGTFAVSVRAPEPTINTPGYLEVEATGPGGAVVTYSVTATPEFAWDPVWDVSCGPASGSTFHLGGNWVDCRAISEYGFSVGSFTVQVTDRTAPQLTVPSDITVDATDRNGATVTYSTTATDLVDTSPTVDCDHPSGDVFPIGTTTVTCIATDDYSNSQSSWFTVSVVVHDQAAPALEVPAPMTVEATGPDGAVVTYSASATDVFDINPSVVCVPASSSTFPLGTTTVDCTATDASSNSSQQSFTVTVQDTTAPTIDLPSDGTVNATSLAGAAVVYTATAADAVDTNPSLSCDWPTGSVFPVGTTTVTCEASDAAQNVSSRSFTITVVINDTTPPTMVLPNSASIVTTGPNGAYVNYVVGVTDVFDLHPSLTCVPASGSLFPVGTTTVTCTASDVYGNEIARSFRVTVARVPVPGNAPLATHPTCATPSATVAPPQWIVTLPSMPGGPAAPARLRVETETIAPNAVGAFSLRRGLPGTAASTLDLARCVTTVPTAGPAPAAQPTAGLPDTGASGGRDAVWAVVLIGVGAALTLAARRRRVAG